MRASALVASLAVTAPARRRTPRGTAQRSEDLAMPASLRLDGPFFLSLSSQSIAAVPNGGQAAVVGSAGTKPAAHPH